MTRRKDNAGRAEGRFDSMLITIDAENPPRRQKNPS